MTMFINVLLPFVAAVFISVVGVIAVIACWALYRLIGKANGCQLLTILLQAVISLVGTAVIGLIAFGFAVGFQTILSALK